jgi:teichuronic acid biosynthesis glycosyltransferase TuaC
VSIGDGPLRGELAGLVERKGLRDRVAIRRSAPPPDVARWMRAADLFCLPSHSEGCPNVMVEALASGCPVVAANVGGIPELARSESTILVPPQQPERLAEALREGLTRPWNRQIIHATSGRTWDHVAAETLAVCETVAGTARPLRTAGKPPRLRIAVVSSYFPSGDQKYRGHSAFQTLLELQKVADIQVFSPLAAYPNGRNSRSAAKQYGPFPTQYFGYPALPLLSRPFNGWVCLRELLPRLRAAQPDLILNYWLYPEGFSAVQAGRVLGVPVIVGSIGSDLRRIADPFTRHFVRRTVREAAGVITVSDDLRQRAIALGARPENVSAILNGCDRSIFHRGDRDGARRQAGYTAGGSLILYVGSLLRTKGLVELMGAFQTLAAERPELRLAMIGEGPMRDEIGAFARRHGLEDRILLFGYKLSREVGDWMRAADLFCLPSYSEGCPNVVVEALACGLPVVASNVGGVGELVPEFAGVLPPPRDRQALERALRTALDKEWDCERIARASARTWGDVAAETYALCLQTVERECGSRRSTSTVC